jgi:hypothetical protein
MATCCEECKYLYLSNKKLRGIDGGISFLLQYKCRCSHRISKSSAGWIPLSGGKLCKDYIKK